LASYFRRLNADLVVDPAARKAAFAHEIAIEVGLQARRLLRPRDPECLPDHVLFDRAELREQLAPALRERDEQIAIRRRTCRVSDVFRRRLQRRDEARIAIDHADAHAVLDPQLVDDRPARVDGRGRDDEIRCRFRQRSRKGRLQPTPGSVGGIGQQLAHSPDFFRVAVDEHNRNVTRALVASQPHGDLTPAGWQARQVDQIGVDDRPPQHLSEAGAIDIVELDMVAKRREAELALATLGPVPVNQTDGGHPRGAFVTRPRSAAALPSA
jgi:hypothetical protein